MYKNVLQSIIGVETYAIVSMLLFLAVFVGMIVFVLRMRANVVDQLSRLPLEDENTMGNVIQQR